MPPTNPNPNLVTPPAAHRSPALAAHVREGLARRRPAPSRGVDEGPVAASAVLAALFDRDGEPHVWVLRKAAHLRRHAGQIALPGGKHEPGDATLVDTALREAHEEIGLPPSLVETVGSLEAFSTRTGFVVTPVVGVLMGPFEPVADPAEVARVFSAPLRLFASPGVPRVIEALPTFGPLPTYEIDGEIVWGATGYILRTLARALAA